MSDVSSSNDSLYKLKPRLNVFQGAALIAGVMIGSGIYATPSLVLGYVNSTGGAMIIWILGAVFAFAGAMSYGEWGSRVTQSGGDAPFLDYVYRKPRRLAPILFTWVRIVLINPGYCANSAYLIGKYLLLAIPSFSPSDAEKQWYTKVIGALVLLFHSLICIPSNHLAGNFTLAITLISMSCLLCIVILGIVLLSGALPDAITFENFSHEHLFKGTSSEPENWAFAFYFVMWAYDGWFNLASSLGEVKNPEKNIFRSTLLGVGVTTVLFLLVNFSFLLGLPFNEFIAAESTLPIKWGYRLFEQPGQILTSSLFCITLLACCFITLFSSSRIAQAAGEARMFPFHRFFAQLSPRFGTPISSLFLNFVLSIIILLAAPDGDAFTFIIVLVSYPVWVFITLTLVGLIYVKYQEGGLWKRPKELSHLCVWVNALCPGVVVPLGIFLLVMPFFDKKIYAIASGAGLACILVGLIPYYFLEIKPNRKHRV